MSEWRPVYGYEEIYEVSDDGRVRRRSNQRELKFKSGEKRPTVSLSRNNKCHQRRVSILMLEAFVSPRPPGYFACHKDDDCAHNSLDNLYWGTQSDNERDKVRNGRHNHARRTHCKNGHELVQIKSQRYCRTCHKEYTKNWRANFAQARAL